LHVCSGVVGTGYPMIMPAPIPQSEASSCLAVTANATHEVPLMTESPPMLPPPLHGMVSAALPFVNVMIPVTDNLVGPVNVAVSPSVDPSGADLPING